MASFGLSPLDAQAMEATKANTLTGLAPRDTTVPIVTTSSVLGIAYKDGILMVADTLASYGRMSRFKDTSRFFTLGSHTALATTGDYSDHQMLERTLSLYALKDFLHDDNCAKSAHQYGALLSRLLYQKRSRMNPWWLSVIVGGYQGEKPDVVPEASASVEPPRKKKPFVLGYVDMYGTFYEEDIIATGLGRYFAITLMRNQHRPDMSEEEARKLLEECMRLLFYRDCGASNRIQFTKITSAGVQVEEPYVIDSKWDYEGYVKKTMDMDLAGCAW
ncbi:putative 20S proteasome subunit beta 7 [Besnoitia besnoiti]|uniref:Proteasome subunit beta n=1 Tax=Besnoitia besnoiti TaxID=94643 RepID=A0A2A9MKW3_BESBE|nr:putative 20S proteasome subunit beta 7 [Besnoitia besnoiti]PFH36072.1 putative 20S proteasome subunit beta 7 [Besnoitia besnoiti]